MAWFSGAVEGVSDQAVLDRLLSHHGHQVQFIKVCGGKNKLDQKIAGYNSAARYGHWLVLRDLNHDAGCGPELRARLLPQASPMMQLRIVVHEIEAWLMGDIEKFAQFFGVSRDRIPTDLEGINDPKNTLINVVRNSRKSTIKEDMIPRPRSGASEGPAYASRLAEFALEHWRPEEAANLCDSLARCMRRLGEFH